MMKSSVVLMELHVTFFQSLKPSVHLFTQLSKVLKLSKVQEVRQSLCVYCFFCTGNHCICQDQDCFICHFHLQTSVRKDKQNYVSPS